MLKGATLKVQERSGIVILGGLSALVLAAFFFLWINPALKSMDGYESRIEDLRFKIEKQNKLLPLYQQLASRKKAKLPQELIVSARTTLPKSQIDTILSVIREHAVAAGLKMVTVKPDLEALQENPGLISADAVIRGPFPSLRDFLYRVAKIPYLTTVEEIQVKNGDEEKEITVKLWLAVE